MRVFFWILLLFFVPIGLFAQETKPDSSAMPPPSAKPAITETENDSGDPPQLFELIFNRSFLLGGSPDSVPLNTFNSGTYSLGIAFRHTMANGLLALRVAPSVSWLRLVYNQTDLKTFPTIADSTVNLDQERHHLTAVDLPISLMWNISRDEDDDPRFFVEAGAYVGYLVGANYKSRFDVGNLRVTNRLGQLQRLDGQFDRLRYGAFGRVGYKWIAVYGNLRFTSVFGEFTNSEIRPRGGDGYLNPEISSLEIGISLLL